MTRLPAILLTLAAVTAALIGVVAGQQPASGATACVVTARNGPNSTCGPYDSKKITASNGYNTYVSNNGWACGSNGSDCGPQRLTAHSASSWSVASAQRAGNTAVLTYPDVNQILTRKNGDSRSLKSFANIRSYYKESMPHNRRTIAQAAYDLWLDHTTGPNEVMIWVDNVHRGTGGSRVLTHHTFFHVRYTLLQYGGPGGELIWSRNKNAGHGTVHILAMLKWLIHHHHESRTTGIGQVDFGWEICSTGGAREVFKVADYTLRTKHA